MTCARLLCLILTLALAGFGQATAALPAPPAAAMSCCAEASGAELPHGCPGCPTPARHHQQCCPPSPVAAVAIPWPHQPFISPFFLQRQSSSADRFSTRNEPPRLPPPERVAA